MKVGNLKEIVTDFFGDFFDKIDFTEKENVLTMTGHKDEYEYKCELKPDNSFHFEPDMLHHYLENLKGDMVRDWRVMRLKDLTTKPATK